MREKRKADIVLVVPEDNHKNGQLQLTQLRSRPEPGNCVNVFGDGNCVEKRLVLRSFCFKSLYVRSSVRPCTYIDSITDERTFTKTNTAKS